jgi:hypothetical protein
MTQAQDKLFSKCKEVIILLAHYDDELFVFPWIKAFLRANLKVSVFWLTNSEGLSRDPNKKLALKRKHESMKFIQKLYDGQVKMQHIGIENNFKDGYLHDNLEAALQEIEILLGDEPTLLISPYIENGHFDHDSVHILATRLNQVRMNIITNLSFPIYSPGLVFPFKVLQFDNKKVLGVKIEHRLTFPEIFTIAKAPIIYKSQVRTWLGLYLSMLFRIVVTRKYQLIETDGNGLEIDISTKLFNYRNKNEIQNWKSKIRYFLESDTP